MQAYIDDSGYLIAPGIQPAPRPHIEHGTLTTIRGIIVHQADSDTAQSTLSAYMKVGANGAHFLIDRDGTIYQTASLKRRTRHVGKLRSKCIAEHTCSPSELHILRNNEARPSVINRIEMRKTVPARYPSNDDAIGIEIVGRCTLPAEYDQPGLTREARERIRGEKGIFEPVSVAQNAALHRLVADLTALLKVPEDQIYRHPEVSRKNPTEAETARWK